MLLIRHRDGIMSLFESNSSQRQVEILLGSIKELTKRLDALESVQEPKPITDPYQVLLERYKGLQLDSAKEIKYLNEQLDHKQRLIDRMSEKYSKLVAENYDMKLRLDE